MKRSPRAALALALLPALPLGGCVNDDVHLYEVTLRGVPIKLRPREFALLEFFMRNPSQVFSRDVILEKVWGLSYPGETRTVVFGHWARQGLVVAERVRGLDTGCVWGKQLTAWIAEEDRLVQVPAARVYSPTSLGD